MREAELMAHAAEQIVLRIIQGTALALICLTIIFIVTLFAFKIFGYRLDYPWVKHVIEFFGIYHLDTSDIATQFKNAAHILQDQIRKNRFILVAGPHDYKIQIIQKYAMTSVDQPSFKMYVSGSAVCNYVPAELLLSENFANLVKMITYYRPQVPLNAFILTLSLKDPAPNIVEIIAKLKQLDGYQDYPVYVIFDDLSALSGFDAFAKITSKHANMIIGETLDPDTYRDKSKYMDSNELSAMILHNITSGLQKLLDLELLEYNGNADVGQAYMFVSSVQSHLASVLENIIQIAFYNKSNNFLRGVYLSDSGQELYCQRLWTSLILKDNLVRLTNNSMKLFFTNNISVFILICLLLCLPFTNLDLKKKSSAMMAALEQITPTDQNFRKMIEGMKSVLANKPSAELIPASWVDSIRSKIHKLISHYYDTYLISKIYDQYNNLVSQAIQPDFVPKYESSQDGLFGSKQFLELYYYAACIADLEKAEAMLNQFNVDNSAQSLNAAGKMLLKVDLPEDYDEHEKYFGKSAPRVVTALAQHKTAIQKIFLAKLDDFLAYYSSLCGFWDKAKTVEINLASMRDDTLNYSCKAFRELNTNISAMQEFMKSDGSKSLETNVFEYVPSEKESVSGLLDMLSASVTFGKDFKDSVVKKLSDSNTKLRADLTNLQFPIFGNAMNISPDGKFAISNSLLQINSILSEMVNEGVDAGDLKLNPSVVGIESFIWNTANIKALMTTIEQFKTKVKTQLDTSGIQVRAYLGRVIFNILAAKIQAELVAALENPALIVAADQFALDYRLNNLVENSSDLVMLAGFAKQNQMLDLNFRLTTIMVNQYIKVLTDLYAIIPQQNVYKLNANSILNPAVDQKFITTFVGSSRDTLNKMYQKAKPVLQILDGLYKNNDFISPDPVFAKWNEIRNYFDLSADSSLESMDLFFNKLLNCQSIDALIDFYKTNVVTDTSTLLGAWKNDVLVMVSKKIDSQLADSFMTIYARVAANFDKYLKGYFPFAPQNALDVPKDNLVAFYNLWVLDQKEVAAIVVSFKDDPARNTTLEYKFLAKMQKAMSWVAHIVNPKANPASATVQIRDLRSEEQLADQLIFWRISFYGANDYIQDAANDMAKKVDGDINQTIMMNCLTHYHIDMAQQISSTSAYVFAKDGDQMTTGFSCTSPFAFLRFLAANFYRQNGGTVYLKFAYPVKSASGQTTMNSYISVVLNGLEYFDFQSQG